MHRRQMVPSQDVGTCQYWGAGGGVDYASRAFNKVVDVSGLEEEEPILDPAGRDWSALPTQLTVLFL